MPLTNAEIKSIAKEVRELQREDEKIKREREEVKKEAKRIEEEAKKLEAERETYFKYFTGIALVTDMLNEDEYEMEDHIKWNKEMVEWMIPHVNQLKSDISKYCMSNGYVDKKKQL